MDLLDLIRMKSNVLRDILIAENNLLDGIIMNNGKPSIFLLDFIALREVQFGNIIKLIDKKIDDWY